MAIAALAMQAYGAASGAVGSYFSDKSTQANLNYQADTADINAKIAELGAQDTLLKGQREKQSSQLQTAALKGSQRARMAGSGIDLSSDTATNLLSTTDLIGNIDAQTIEQNAIKSAWGYRTQATNYSNQGKLNRAGVNAVNPGESGFNSLLNGATQVASSWYSLNKDGAFG